MSKDYKHRIEPGRDGECERDRVINRGRKTETDRSRDRQMELIHRISYVYVKYSNVCTIFP